ncbi:MAG TPA: hypothetical protein VHH12_12235 [Mycobacterium sp.]|nr:hypothetical protein [Mycobacterium sp.]
MKLIGGLIARYPALYDVLDALIEFGYERWPFDRRTTVPQRRATTT